MAEIRQILLGAFFTAAVCWAAGRLLLARVVPGLYRAEAHLLAFLTGSAVFSLFTFCLCVIHQARKGVFLWTGLALLAAAVWRERRLPPGKRLPPLPRLWTALFASVFLSFFVVYFVNALAPEVSPDGSGYHLGNVNRFWLAHGFVWTHHNMYSYLSQGLEMLFLVAYSFGRHPAAALVHLTYQTALPFLMITFGLRNGIGRAATFAALLVYASPVVGMDGSIAYNDIALCATLFAIVSLLQVWGGNNNAKLLIIIGMLCGFAYAIKYTSATVVLLAVGYTLWRRRSLRPAPALLAGVACSAGPWILRNWIWLGNPAAPFFNRWFPNPFYHPGMEAQYLSGLRQYEGLQHWWQLPLELTLNGGAGVTGVLGPVFLLAPLALLALRDPLGRRMLAPAVLFAVPAFFNVGTRFLIPSLPFLAMTMGIAFQNSWGVMPALAVFQAVLCWHTMLPKYTSVYTWRLSTNIPWDAALRRTSSEDFITRHSGDFPVLRQMEKNLPPKARIFSFAGRPEAYCNREILISYESAEANLMNDALLAPFGDSRPSLRARFAFAAQSLQAVRVVQAAAAKSYWSASEMRVFHAGRELPRDAGWRLTARPNGWEVQLAFDNNAATRWLSWEEQKPGQYLEIRFARPETLDAVTLEIAKEGNSKPRLEGQGNDGRWTELSRAPEITPFEPPHGLRRAATLELKARGVGYLLIEDSDYAFEDMRKRARYWGITEIGASGGTHLFRID